MLIIKYVYIENETRGHWSGVCQPLSFQVCTFTLTQIVLFFFFFFFFFLVGNVTLKVIKKERERNKSSSFILFVKDKLACIYLNRMLRKNAQDFTFDCIYDIKDEHWGNLMEMKSDLMSIEESVNNWIPNAETISRTAVSEFLCGNINLLITTKGSL